MSANNIEKQLRAGINAAKKGNKARARQQLEAVIAVDGDNELAWIWMASVVETKRQRRFCLERVLEINPRNTRAREALNSLVGIGMDDDIDSAAIQDAAGETGSGNTWLWGVGIGLAIVFAILILPGIFVPPPDFAPTPTDMPAQEEAARRAAQFARATVAAASPTPSLSPTFPGVRVTRGSVDLPPTFTPTTTYTPTVTPTPTATPLPLIEFTLLIASRSDNEVNPSLYQTRGDGSQANRIGNDIREVAYNLRADRIAFVRSVTYSPDELDGDATEPITVDELFVAPADDINAAEQVTRLRGGAISSPTFSPDSRTIVFASDVDGDYDLYQADLQTGTTGAITFNNQIDRDPHWSYDGGQLVFTSDRESPGLTEIYTLRFVLDGSTDPNNGDSGHIVTRITSDNGNSYQPQWSPDNAFIVYANDDDGDGDIHLMNANGQRNRILTQNDSEELRPKFTPDGRRVVWLSNQGGERFQLFAYDRATRTITQITDGESNVTAFDYQPGIRYRVPLLPS